jgi:hypothetical protein
LDGLPGAEIVVSSQKGVSVFHNDGSLYWFNGAVKTDMAAALPLVIWMMIHALKLWLARVVTLRCSPTMAHSPKTVACPTAQHHPYWPISLAMATWRFS